MVVKRFLKFPLLVIILWNILIHVRGITSPLLDYQADRQCHTASIARNYVRHGMHFLNPELDGFGKPMRAGTEFPIYSYLLAILFDALGPDEMLGRGLSTCFAALGAVYLFLFLRQKIGETTALLAAMTMCVLPLHLYFARAVQPEIMALWGLLAFLFHGERYLKNPRVVDGTITLLFGALSCLIQPSFIFPLISLWTLLLSEQQGWRTFLFAKGYAVAMGIVGLTLAWYDYAKNATIQSLPFHSVTDLENFKPMVTWEFWKAHLISPFPALWATWPGLLLAGFGLWALHRQKVLPFFRTWFLIMWVYEILLGQYGVTHFYMGLLFAPIMATMIAFGSQTLWQRLSPAHLPRWCILVLLASVPAHSTLLIRRWFELDQGWLIEAHARLMQLTRADDFILANTSSAAVSLYYLDRYGYSCSIEKQSPLDVETLLSRGVRYFVTPRDVYWESHPEWRAFFEDRGICVVEQSAYLIYALRPAMAQPS